MNRKAINAVLRKKHNEFVASIKDEEVQKLVKANSLVSGGAIVSMLLNEPVNDIDYYFTNKETCLAVARYYTNLFNTTHNLTASVWEKEDGQIKLMIRSDGVGGEEQDDVTDNPILEGIFDDKPDKAEAEKEKYQPVYITSNAISLSNKVQLVVRFYGDAEEIHKNYDYIHCTCHWTSKDGKVELPAKALESIITKQLFYSGSKYPLCSIFRARKFIERGWTINAGQFLKMALQLNELDLMNVATLEDQLIGVDSAFFMQVVDDIKAKSENDESFSLTPGYLVSIIDKIF
jgi:hypothetical protein